MVSAPLSAIAPHSGTKEKLRLWIRLLRAAHTIEGELRERLKRDFGTTLPRFDVMAGFVVRARRDGDRRTSIVRLTEVGIDFFERMARAHEGWIAELLGSVGDDDARRLSGMLRAFRSEWEGEH